jgi:ribosome-associated translation inhibitor RaiA
LVASPVGEALSTTQTPQVRAQLPVLIVEGHAAWRSAIVAFSRRSTWWRRIAPVVGKGSVVRPRSQRSSPDEAGVQMEQVSYLSIATEGEPMQVAVTARTTMSPEQKRRATQRLEALEPLASGPVLGAHVWVDRDDNPSIARPYHAEGEINVNGHLVRAHVVGPSTDVALAGLCDRLERQLRRLADRRVTHRRETGEAQPGEWRHGDLPAQRPEFFPRPPEERRVLRRKTFAVEPMTPMQAAADMVDLDHDFYLFHDARTGNDAVVHRLRDDGRLGLIESAATAPSTGHRWLVVESNRFSEPVALPTAIEEMNAVDHRFLYFVDRDSGRGNVIYRRYDGHYGLVEARV